MSSNTYNTLYLITIRLSLKSTFPLSRKDCFFKQKNWNITMGVFNIGKSANIFVSCFYGKSTHPFLNPQSKKGSIALGYTSFLNLPILRVVVFTINFLRLYLIEQISIILTFISALINLSRKKNKFKIFSRPHESL